MRASFVSIVTAVAIGAGSVQAKCKVYPGEEGWPSVEEWDKFNETVNGRLLGPVVPLSAPCHHGGLGTYNAAECNALTDEWYYTPVHLSRRSLNAHMLFAPPNQNIDPSDIMWPLFTNNTCLYNTNQSTPCTIGYYPVYVVNVTSAEEISTTIKYAEKKNLPLNIKNTGHDFLGKSTKRGSLSIWTHYLKDLEYIEEYTGKTDYSGPAFKVGAGIQSSEIYDAATAQGKMIVAGEQPTVGYAGGYLSGGGHSPLSSLLGMAVDSVIEFTIVLANGSIVDVDQYSSPDLFWAVRGGGGCESSILYLNFHS
jgi:hypothetical protein